jgi:nicotinate-nucleotide adenylyltransferase
VADLDQVWLMPNAQPAHRDQPLAGAEDRMRMVEIALDGEAGLLPSRLEADRGGVSYTIDTIRELGQRFPGQRFELLLGADAAALIRSWHDADAVLREGSFVIFNRPGSRLVPEQLHQLGFAPERTRIVQLKTPDVAAHEIRKRLARGAAIGDLVPRAVAAYIQAHDLYGARPSRQLG